MFKTIAPAEMKRVETRVMQETVITGDQLMQKAASHVAKAVRRHAPKGPVVCICGAGNNGGDGLAAMRMLAQRGYFGECWMLPGTLSPDSTREMERLVSTAPGMRVRWMEKEALPELCPSCAIDAMFGTGLTRPLSGHALDLCRRLNGWQQKGVPVIAVDIPSGLNGLTGEVLGEAVIATETVTFHRPKHGLYLKDGPDYTGNITVGEIGLPAEYDDADGYAVLEKKDLSHLLPSRKRNTHKGSYGRVLLFAGSRGMAGAAAIAALAALKTGAGLVTIACPESILDIVQILCPCATCLPLPSDAEEAWPMLADKLSWADAIGAGCGLGTSQWAQTMMAQLMNWLAEHPMPAVMDADGLNLLSRMEAAHPRVFITPHPAEAGRLLKQNTADVLSHLEEAAQTLARQFGPVILKGACSLLCDGERYAINPYGTPAMAKGGSGDALTGIVAALLAGRAAGAYAMDDLTLMQTACALHGLAGEKAAQQSGERGLLATELCEELGQIQKDEHSIEEREETIGICSVLGRQVTVTVEHPAGQKDKNRLWKRNYGHVQEVLQEENRWQDACILGAEQPLEWAEGCVLARILTQEGDVWLIGPPEIRLSEAQIAQECAFLGKIQIMECL